MKKTPPPSRKSQAKTDAFTRAIANKERRKMYARQAKPHGGVWFGFGFAGLVGWSIVAPMLLGLGLGIWLDLRFPSPFSWTLALMLAGLTIGCLTVWEWVSREQERMAKAHPPVDDSPSLEDSPNKNRHYSPTPSPETREGE